MARILTIAAAQMGATHRTSPRSETLSRMLTLLTTASSQGAQLVLFPEIAFTTFFPRHLIHDEAELDSWYERGEITTSPNTKPLFDKARELGVDIVVGYAELTDDRKRFNTCVYYSSRTGSVLAKYRKIHLPGTVEPFSDPGAVNNLEKRYFLPGDLGFEAFRPPGLLEEGEAGPIVGMMICNDRRWAESWRVLGLQGVEIVCCGYNTCGVAPHIRGSDPKQDPAECRAEALFHHKLVMQAHSYTNATYSVCAARCGRDDDKYDLIAGSCIIDPEGRIVAEAEGDGDEVVLAKVDLAICRQGKEKVFAFEKHRRVEAYGRITAQTGVVEPPV